MNGPLSDTRGMYHSWMGFAVALGAVLAQTLPVLAPNAHRVQEENSLC